MNMKIESFSAEETYELGKKLGSEANPGDVLTLIGDLGVGKTVFTQGFADGLEITEPISSPTFTIVQVYEEADCHFIILMYTASAISKIWMRSVTRTIFTEMV